MYSVYIGVFIDYEPEEDDEVLPAEPQEDRPLKEEHVGIIVGALASLILLLFTIAVFIILRHHRRKKNHDIYDQYEKHHINTDSDEFTKVLHATKDTVYIMGLYLFPI